jgi:fructokinase
MSRLPVVVAGEALVDVVVTAAGETSSSVGGSPLNVAVGLARLGVPTMLVTRIGDDERGRRVADHVRDSGATLSSHAVVPGSATSTATAHLDQTGTARYDFDLSWDLEPLPLPPACALHVGSLGSTRRPGRRAVEDLVRQAADGELFVSYDPNVRPGLVADGEEAWHDVLDLASRCRLVKLSDEDVAVLRPSRPVDEVVGDLLRSEATELVVVTRGAEGATAHANGLTVHEPAPETGVVDTVGAGDSFMAALLAVLDDWEIPADGPGALEALDADHVAMLLRGAAKASAVTVSRRGANPPTRGELPPTWPL